MMGFAAWRLVVGLIIGLILGTAGLGVGVTLGQDDRWYEISKSGVRAVDEGRFDDAEELFRDALKISDAYGEDDPRRATSVNNLA